jgi:hypothetical protein
MTKHLGCPLPSPAPFDKIGQRFRRVAFFAEVNGCLPAAAGGTPPSWKVRASVISTLWTVVLAAMSLAVPGLRTLTFACSASSFGQRSFGENATPRGRPSAAHTPF